MRAAQLSRTYAALVAIIAASWWLLLFSDPGARTPFLWAGLPTTVFFSFVPADLVFVVVVPVVYCLTGRRAWWYVFVGAFGYATLFTLALCSKHESGWLGGWLMVLGSAINLALTWGMRKDAPS